MKKLIVLISIFIGFIPNNFAAIIFNKWQKVDQVIYAEKDNRYSYYAKIDVANNQINGIGIMINNKVKYYKVDTYTIRDIKLIGEDCKDINIICKNGTFINVFLPINRVGVDISITENNKTIKYRINHE